MDPWIVTPMERARHMEQFRGLNPVDGVITGTQSKGLLLQSGLPPPVLGQIWSLADANCDGKMDINEFSVACKLITMKLRGFEIPPVLPPPLKAVLACSGTTTPISPAPSIGSGIGTPPIRPAVPPPVGGVAMPGMAMPGGIVSPPHQPGVAAQPIIPGQQYGGLINQPMVGAMAMGAQPMVSGVGMMQPLVGGMPTGAVPPGSLAIRSATPPVAGVRPVVPVQDAIHRSASITSHDSVCVLI